MPLQLTTKPQALRLYVPQAEIDALVQEDTRTVQPSIASDGRFN